MLDKIRFYLIKKLIMKNEMVILNCDIYADSESGIPTVNVPAGWTLVHDGSLWSVKGPNAYVTARGIGPGTRDTNIPAEWVRTNAPGINKDMLSGYLSGQPPQPNTDEA